MLHVSPIPETFKLTMRFLPEAVALIYCSFYNPVAAHPTASGF